MFCSFAAQQNERVEGIGANSMGNAGMLGRLQPRLITLCSIITFFFEIKSDSSSFSLIFKNL